jgi:hypothetical protein
VVGVVDRTSGIDLTTRDDQRVDVMAGQKVKRPATAKDRIDHAVRHRQAAQTVHGLRPS